MYSSLCINVYTFIPHPSLPLSLCQRQLMMADSLAIVWFFSFMQSLFPLCKCMCVYKHKDTRTHAYTIGQLEMGHLIWLVGEVCLAISYWSTWSWDRNRNKNREAGSHWPSLNHSWLTVVEIWPTRLVAAEIACYFYCHKFSGNYLFVYSSSQCIYFAE